MKTKYEIWIVENGSMREFRRGMTLHRTPMANMLWGVYDTIEEVRERFRELAEENYWRENGPSESAEDPEADCAKYVQDCVESFNIEWDGDLKWVRCREMTEDDDGNETFVREL